MRFLHGVLCAVSERDHRITGPHANHDANMGEERSHLVDAQGVDGDAGISRGAA